MTQPLTFKRGRRKRPEYGLYYPSACGRYSLYRSREVDGALLPLRWLAFSHGEGFPRLLSRHRTRPAAERACRAHLNSDDPGSGATRGGARRKGARR